MLTFSYDMVKKNTSPSPQVCMYPWSMHGTEFLFELRTFLWLLILNNIQWIRLFRN